MYLATDPFDVARHKLRHLHDRPGPLTQIEVAPAQAGAALLQEDEPPEEDDDPL